MKKQTVILIIVTLVYFANSSFAQTHEIDQQKYWVYRNRLQKEYMYIDYKTPYTAGSCIPAGIRNYDSKTILFGDGLIYLGNYLQVLATEYALLNYYNLPVQGTLDDLYYAIEAVYRLDYNAECSFRPPGSTPSDADINGFLIRDDVDTDYVQNNHAYFDDMTADWKASSDFISHQNFTNYFALEMSQDQCWHLFLGFALISKLLDGVVSYDSKGNSYNYAERVRDMTHNIIYQLSGTDYPPPQRVWVLYNPVTNNEVNRGYMVQFNAYGFGKAASEICHDDENVKGSATDPALALFMANWLVEDWNADDCAARALSTSGDVKGLNNFMLQFKETDLKSVYKYPQFPLIHLLLFPDLYTENEKLLASTMLDDFKQDLDIAPMDGPGRDAPWFWTSSNCLVYPEDRGGGDGQKYNGLDYMLLHNLYYLFKKEPLDLSAYTFPLVAHRLYGTLDAPVTLSGKDMVYSQVIPANANVTLLSDNSVVLNPGFQTTSGDIFKAAIDYYTFNSATNSSMGQANLKSASNSMKYNYIKMGTITTKNEPISALDEKDMSNSEALIIYPNPNEGIFILEISKLSNVSIYNTEGQKVYSKILKDEKNTIDISDQPAGLYTMKLIDSQGLSVKKIVKR